MAMVLMAHFKENFNQATIWFGLIRLPESIKKRPNTQAQLCYQVVVDRLPEYVVIRSLSLWVTGVTVKEKRRRS